MLLRPLLFRSISARTFFTSCARQAGHNKWSKIKEKKGASDIQKSLAYSKASNEILTAARRGGSVDPALNVQLATALKKAKELGVPKGNIEKALARAAGGKDATGIHLLYEALAFDSVGLIIECCTDNVNRTLHNVREILNSRGARMTAVKYMFDRRGRAAVSFSKSSATGHIDEILDLGIENGAVEVNEIDGLEENARVVEFVSQPEDLGQLEASLREGIDTIPDASIIAAELVYIPRDVQVVDGEKRQRLEDLVEALAADGDTFKRIECNRPSTRKLILRNWKTAFCPGVEGRTNTGWKGKEKYSKIEI